MIALDETHFPLKSLPKPWLAAILNVVPGLGHLYLRQEVKGFLFLNVAALNLIAIFGALLAQPNIRQKIGLMLGPDSMLFLKQFTGLVNPLIAFTPLLFLLVVAFWICVVFDAYHCAKEQVRCGYASYRDNFKVAVRCSWILHLSAATIFMLILRVFSPVEAMPEAASKPSKSEQRAITTALTSAWSALSAPVARTRPKHESASNSIESANELSRQYERDVLSDHVPEPSAAIMNESFSNR